MINKQTNKQTWTVALFTDWGKCQTNISFNLVLLKVTTKKILKKDYSQLQFILFIFMNCSAFLFLYLNVFIEKPLPIDFLQFFDTPNLSWLTPYCEFHYLNDLIFPTLYTKQDKKKTLYFFLCKDDYCWLEFILIFHLLIPLTSCIDSINFYLFFT